MYVGERGSLVPNMYDDERGFLICMWMRGPLICMWMREGS